MALTTHEDIRIEAGFQQEYSKESFLETPTGSTVFHVRSDYNEKFVPNYGTGGTIAGVSDVQAWLGLSGIGGVSRMNITAIDINSGSVTLDTAPATGSSLTVSYASSQISSNRIERVRLQAEAMVNKKLVLCYDLPMSPVPSDIKSMASRLASSLLMIRGYGVGSRDTATDGYALYEILMGSGKVSDEGSEVQKSDVGEIGMICSNGYALVDDGGIEIPRNDADTVDGGSGFVDGGRVTGRMFDVTEEPFRMKPHQEDVNRPQPGSGRWG